MLGSQEYLVTQIDLPLNNLQLPPDIIEQQLKNDRPRLPKLSEVDLPAHITQCFKEAISHIQRIDSKHEVIFEPSNHTEKMTKKLVKLITALKVFQLHFEFLLEVMTSSDNDIADIILRYDPVSRFYSPVTKKVDLCLISISEAFENVIFFLLDEVEKVTDNFFLSKDDGTIEIKNDKETLAYAKIIASKLETMIEYFPEAATLRTDDIFAQKRTSELWKNLYESCEIVKIADKETLKSQYKMLYTILTVANALLYKSQKTETKTLKDRCLMALTGIYYGAMTKKAEFQASLYLSEPKMETAFKLWNFVEKGWVKDLIKLTLPTIDYDKKFYIQRLFPSVTREVILKEYEEGSLNKIVENTFKPEDLTPKKESVLESIFTKRADAIRVRIISPFPLVLQGIGSEKARAMAMKAVNKVNQFLKNGTAKVPEVEPDEVIFHIHGGGFTSGSSSSHRNYLYRWAKSLNKIIFSVDYRLAPENPYPAGLDDVWQAYNWIINYAEPLLGIKTRKIVLAGDSAGGNLVMALALRTIKMGVRVPDGCFLAYPAMNMYPTRFVPSYFLAIEDIILPYSMLKLCIKAYIPEEFQPKNDPFLSPVIAGDELLEKLPPIRIATGNDDPLHDDNWRFLHRMKLLNKDIRMVIYENMPHGFLSFDQIDDYKIVLDGTYKLLTELFGGNSIVASVITSASATTVNDKEPASPDAQIKAAP